MVHREDQLHKAGLVASAANTQTPAYICQDVQQQSKIPVVYANKYLLECVSLGTLRCHMVETSTRSE